MVTKVQTAVAIKIGVFHFGSCINKLHHKLQEHGFIFCFVFVVCGCVFIFSNSGIFIILAVS